MTSDNLDLVPGGAWHDWLTDPPQQGEEAWCIQQHQPVAPADLAVQLHSITAASWLACCKSAEGCVLFCTNTTEETFVLTAILFDLHKKYGKQAYKSACKSAYSANDDLLFWADVQHSAWQPDHVLPPPHDFQATTDFETANQRCMTQTSNHAEWCILVQALWVMHAHFHRHALEELEGFAAQVRQAHAPQVHNPDGCAQWQGPWVQHLPYVLLHKPKVPVLKKRKVYAFQQS